MSEDLEAGTRFGHYQFQELLGRGGMGEVWRAYDTVADRVVAVKVLPPSMIRDESFVKRFHREARVAARLNNAHVIPIHTYGEIDGRLYVDMRLVEGNDLQHVLSNGPVEFEWAVSLIDQVASALNAAHKVGLVHRDIKPSNILLDEDDCVYLIDFGIARTADDKGLTDTGAMIGTYAYMAPERIRSSAIDARSDVYALACVLHECLTGHQPYPGDSFEQLAAAHLWSEPPEPSAMRPEVPVQFDAVIAKGMAKDPDDRYQTAVEFARAASIAAADPHFRPAPSHPAQLPSGEKPEARSEPTVRHPVTPTPRRQHMTPPPRRQHISHPSIADAAALPPARPWWRRKAAVIPAAILCAIVLAAAVTLAIPDQRQPPNQRQSTLITGLTDPGGVAVGNDGTVYVTDTYNKRVLKLTAESGGKAERLAFADVSNPVGVAVDSGGTVYVCDGLKHVVLSLAKGSETPAVLPFSGLGYPAGVAVDSAGTNVYVTDLDNNKVFLLAGRTQSELPFTGLNTPNGVAVASDGTVYVADTQNNRVLKWTAGAPTPNDNLALTGLRAPKGVAVASDGTVYVTDTGNSRVVMLPTGSPQTVLPFTDLMTPHGVAVASDGTVYVTDTGTDRVIKLLPE